MLSDGYSLQNERNARYNEMLLSDFPGTKMVWSSSESKANLKSNTFTVYKRDCELRISRLVGDELSVL